MHRIILALTALAGLLLGGCAQMKTALDDIKSVYTYATTTTVSSGQAAIVANVYDTLKQTAAGYGQYCKAQGFPRPVCSASNRRIVIKAIRDGDLVRAQLETPLQSGQDVPATLYNTLVDVVNTLRSEPITVGKAK